MAGALGAGIAAFLVACFFDWVSIRRIRWGKQGVILAVIALGGYALYSACFRLPRFELPVPAICLGWVLMSLSALLFCYSLFLEIPFSKTYTKPGVSGELVTNGTWALVRHPGVLWFTLLLVGLILVARTRVLLVAAPVWLVLDVILVVIQDKVVFPRIFPGYSQYQRQTPMLLPTRKSIMACVKSLRAKEVTR